MPRKGGYGKSKNFKRKINLPFLIYAIFETNLVPEHNGKENTERSDIFLAVMAYKLVCVNDKFNKPFKKRYLGKDAV